MGPIKFSVLLKIPSLVLCINLLQSCGFVESDCRKEEYEIIEKYKIVSDNCAGTKHALVLSYNEESDEILETNSLEVNFDTTIIYLKYIKYDTIKGFAKFNLVKNSNVLPYSYKRAELTNDEFVKAISDCDCQKLIVAQDEIKYE